MTATFAGHSATSHKPDAAERSPQLLIHELCEIACMELDRIAGSGKIATSEDEGRLVAVGPAESLGFKT